jgi:hypothetical protein
MIFSNDLYKEEKVNMECGLIQNSSHHTLRTLLKNCWVKREGRNLLSPVKGRSGLRKDMLKRQ